MKLSEQQIEQYHRDGYVVARNFVASRLVEPVRRRLAELAAGDHDWPPHFFQVVDPARFQSARGTALPFGVQRPSMREQVFADITHHEDLIGAMEQILGGPIEFFTDQAMLRHGRVGKGNSFYHQDSNYWHIPPRGGCNVWITLDEVGPDSGAMAIMPGTQHDWEIVPHEAYFDEPTSHAGHTGVAYQRHRIPAEKIDFSREILFSMQPGDAIFFTNYTWHRTEVNSSGEDKFAYAIAYRTVESATR